METIKEHVTVYNKGREIAWRRRNSACGTEPAAFRITSLRDNNKNMSEERVISSNLQSTVERVFQRQPSLYNTKREKRIKHVIPPS